MTSSRDPDPVLREYPVFMSKALADQVYLIQHLLKPADVSHADQVLEAKIKPGQGKIQLKLDIDLDTRYDIQKGEHLAAAAAGICDTALEDMNERPILSEQVVESQPIVNSAKASRYIVGVLRDGQIFLTPLKSIVQMKDKFHFLDEADESSRKKASENKDEEKEVEVTKVTQKFTQNRPAAFQSRYNSYSNFKKKQEAEPWIELNYYTKDIDEFNKLFSGNAESDTPFYVISRKDYFEATFPKLNKVSAVKENRSIAQKPTNYQLRLLPLPEQLRNIMINGKVLKHSQLVTYLRAKLRVPFDQVSLLRSIQTVAVLVQGVWVVKSDLIYPSDYVSPVHGIPGVRMQESREIILNLYTKVRVLMRREMCRLTRLPNEEVTEILSNLARVVRQKGWEFLYPPDQRFMKRYPEVSQRQATMWQMKEAKRQRASSSASKKEDSLMMKPPIGIAPKRRPSRDESSPSSITSSVVLDQIVKQEKVTLLLPGKVARRRGSQNRTSDSDSD